MPSIVTKSHSNAMAFCYQTVNSNSFSMGQGLAHRDTVLGAQGSCCEPYLTYSELQLAAVATKQCALCVCPTSNSSIVSPYHAV